MRTDHKGFDFPGNMTLLRKAMLPVMARVKIARTVPEREQIIAKSLSRLNPEDQFWPEALASLLTENGVKESADAHIMALAALISADPEGLSRIILEITPGHPLVKEFLDGMSRASPEFMERLAKGRMDSDQIAIRCYLCHLFRRETSNIFQMFLIDAMARKLPVGLKTSVQEVVADLQSHHRPPVPPEAWGYCLYIGGTTTHQAFYFTENRKELREELKRILPAFRNAMPEASDLAIANALVATLAERSSSGDGISAGSKGAELASVLLDMPFMVIRIRREDEGTITEIYPVEAESVEDARLKAAKHPVLQTQMKVRRMKEVLDPLFETRKGDH